MTDTKYEDVYAKSRAYRPDVREVARGLHQLADFLNDHDLPPIAVKVPLFIFLRGTDHEKMLQLGTAALIPDTWHRETFDGTDGKYISLRRDFDGNVALKIIAVTEGK
jgi:hypothetical protein